MRRALVFTVLAAGLIAVAGAASAQDPKKDALVNDPAVRESLDPGLSQGGRNSPSQLSSESDPELQRAMDRAHGGSTGTTQGDGQTRRPADQPAGLRDAPSGSPPQLGGQQ